MKKTNCKIPVMAIIAVILAIVLVVVGALLIKKFVFDANSDDSSLSAEDVHAKIPGHGFLNAYQTDAQSHWRICKHKTCTDIIDKGDHEWDEGTVITEPSAEADGKTKYVCTVCERTKTVTVPFKTESNDETPSTPDNNTNNDVLDGTILPVAPWPDEIKLADFENFSAELSITSPYDHEGEDELFRIDNNHMKFTAEKASLSTQARISNGDILGAGNSTEYEGADVEAKRKEVTDFVFAILSEKSKFAEDNKNGCYSASADMSVTCALLGITDDITVSNVKISFSDTYVSTIAFEYTENNVIKQVMISLFHFGETSFDLPDIPENP